MARNETSPFEQAFGDLDAFFYIIVVLSFYAISLVLLMIKYIRREQEETSLDYYYSEYVKRTWFQTPAVQNRLALERERKWIDPIMQAELSSPCQPDEANALRETTI